MQRTLITLFSAALALALPLAGPAVADTVAAAGEAPAVNCTAQHREHRALHQEKVERRADRHKLAKDEKADNKAAVKSDEKEVQQDKHAIKSDKQALRRDHRGHPCQDVPKAATGTNPPH
jgi:hypothetical protein